MPAYSRVRVAEQWRERVMALGERASRPLGAFRPSPGRFGIPDQRYREASRVRQRLAACPELDCLRLRLAPGILAAAELRAAENGIGADRVLIAAGTISEDEYIAHLASSLGVIFDRLDHVPWTDCWWDEERVLDAAKSGVLALRVHGEDILVIAPQAYGAQQIIGFLARHPEMAPRLRLTTRACLERFIEWYTPARVGLRAALALKSHAPEFSAAHASSRALLATIICAVAVGAAAAPEFIQQIAEALLAFVFLGWAGLRLLGLLTTGILWRRDVPLKE